eukprot:5091804-Pleurochrysis_carterae.AAC.2
MHCIDSCPCLYPATLRLFPPRCSGTDVTPSSLCTLRANASGQRRGLAPQHGRHGQLLRADDAAARPAADRGARARRRRCRASVEGRRQRPRAQGPSLRGGLAGGCRPLEPLLPGDEHRPLAVCTYLIPTGAHQRSMLSTAAETENMLYTRTLNCYMGGAQ